MCYRAAFILLSLLLSQVIHAEIPTTLYFKNSKIGSKEIAKIINEWAVPVAAFPIESHYYIVQYSEGNSLKIRESLEKVSKVVRYIPDRAYIVRVEGSADDLNHISGVEWVGIYHPYLRIEKGLLEGPKAEDVELEITFFTGEMRKVRVKKSEIPKIAMKDGVEWIQRAKEPMLVGETEGSVEFKSLNGFGSGAKVLQPERLYEIGIHGEGELIAVADSGLDQGRMDDLPKDLMGRVRKAWSLGRPKTGEWDDPFGHGTHVSGLVAGNGAASNGQVRGVAYEADLIIQSFFCWLKTPDGEQRKAVALPFEINKLFKKPYEEGAKIHTNSWQYAGFSDYDIQEAHLDDFIWNHPDMVIIFSAGNSGVDLDQDGLIDGKSIGSPADAKNCITVGASENLVLKVGMQKSWGRLGGIGSTTNIWGADPVKGDTPSNHLNGIAAFSSRGPTEDGRIKPDLVAPGTNNLSLRSRAKEVDPKQFWGIFNEDYLFDGGTSMAVPLVAGSAALVRQYYRTVEKREMISSALIKAALIHGSVDLYPGQFADFKEIPEKRPNMHEGFGRVDLLALPKKSIDDLKGLKEGEAKEFIVTVDPVIPESFRVTLVYTDYPASPAVEKVLVNDLDLTVHGPDGTVHFSNRKTEADRLNNVEHIDIEEPEAGIYRVVINGSSVPLGNEFGRQPYALVFSGAINVKDKEERFGPY